MSLFFFISGYLFKGIDSNKPLKYIRKKIKSLNLSFIKWQIIFLVFHNIFFKMNIYSDYIHYNGIYGEYYSNQQILKNLIKILTFGNTEQLGGQCGFYQHYLVVV